MSIRINGNGLIEGDIYIDDTNSVKVPNTSTLPVSPLPGMIRYSPFLNGFEGYGPTSWKSFIRLGDSVTSPGTTAPLNPSVGAFWLDTSQTPSQLKFWNGTSWVLSSVPSGGQSGQLLSTNGSGGLSWVYDSPLVVVTSNTQAQSGGSYIITASSSVTITLPSNPIAGSYLTVANTTLLSHTIARNGSSIMSLSENMTFDLYGLQILIWYDGTTWRLF